MRLSPSALLPLAIRGPAPLTAGSIALDFEGFPRQHDSYEFVLRLNVRGHHHSDGRYRFDEFAFARRSGSNVMSGDGSPMPTSFATQVLNAEPLTLGGFDIASTEVASAPSAFSSNMALSVLPPADVIIVDGGTGDGAEEQGL